MADKMRIELRDRDFNIIEILDDEYSNLSWDYLRTGGCGSARFSIPRRFCNELNIATDFNVRIYHRNDSTQAWDLWYQGLIQNKIVTIAGDQEDVDIVCNGYQEQLNRIYVDEDYTSDEVSVIVKDILDNHITPNTDITYSGGDIEASSFTPDSMEFNTKAKSAIETLADLVNFEWGVDKDRKFYFKSKSSTVGHRYPLGAKGTSFFSDDSSKDIVNRIIVKGGDVAGSPFTATYNDTQSQAKWGRRDLPVQNTSIVTTQVGQQYADAIFNEKAEIVRRASAKVVAIDDRFEANIPIQLFQIISKGITYGEKKYGTFLYSGRINYLINRISYRSDDNGVLQVSLELGEPKPSVGETIAQIEHRLEQQRSENL